MRVLLISHSSALYGAQRSLLDLALGLRTVGIEAVVSVPEPGPLQTLAKESGFDVKLLPCRNWVNSRGAYHWIRKFVLAKMQARTAASWVKNEDFDLIHTNSVVTPVGAMLARRVHLPHIWHVREGMPPKKGFFFMSFSKVERFIERTTKYMVGISKHTCEGMKTFCPADRISQVYNGPLREEDAAIPLPSKSLAPDAPIRLLCVGRSGPAKGHDVAARALAGLRDKGIHATLTIAGEVGQDFAAKLKEIAPEGLEMPGFVSDTSELYNSHDVLVMASQKEAFGRVTVEAMSRGCLVVGTNSGGTPEIVSDRKTGLLFEPGDVSGLVDRIETLYRDPALAVRLREEAHIDAFARFTRERYARDVAVLYRKAVADA